MADESAAGGYGKPPVEHQFQKGKSGNPKGRPKRIAKDTGINMSLPQLVLKEAERPMTISEGGQLVKTTAGEALLRSMFMTGLKGSAQAQKTLVSLMANALEFKSSERQRANRVVSSDPHEVQRQYLRMLNAGECD